MVKLHVLALEFGHVYRSDWSSFFDHLNQWFPTFWVLSPGILFYKQFWSHAASQLSEIYHFGNFSGPAWTFFKYRYRSRWLGTSDLKNPPKNGYLPPSRFLQLEFSSILSFPWLIYKIKYLKYFCRIFHAITILPKIF